MNKVFQKVLGVLGISLGWSVVWGAVFIALALAIGFVRPQDFGSGENAAGFAGIGRVVGFVSGLVFGTIVSVMECGKPVLRLGLVRMAIWGAVAAAVWPLLTPLDDRMIYILCPLGAVCGALAVWTAHQAKRRESQGIIGRLAAKPLKAACAANS